jgi:hypothetical protein
MRNAIVLLSLLAGTQLMAAELLLPDTYLTHCGIYQHTNTEVVRELTIETNKLWFNASTGDHTCSSGSYNWTAAHPSWFVYIAKDMRVWAYDGDQYLTLLEANAQRGRSISLRYLEERPPAAVVKRLPKAVRKLLPSN